MRCSIQLHQCTEKTLNPAWCSPSKWAFLFHPGIDSQWHTLPYGCSFSQLLHMTTQHLLFKHGLCTVRQLTRVKRILSRWREPVLRQCQLSIWEPSHRRAQGWWMLKNNRPKSWLAFLHRILKRPWELQLNNFYQRVRHSHVYLLLGPDLPLVVNIHGYFTHTRNHLCTHTDKTTCTYTHTHTDTC